MAEIHSRDDSFTLRYQTGIHADSGIGVSDN